jgi:hypothetical protein
VMKKVTFLTILALFVLLTTVPFADGAFAQADDPLPTLSINDVTVNESDGTATFTVSLSSPSSFPVTVNYSTADGTATAGNDYTAASGTLTFAPGEAAKTISVPIVKDNIHEGEMTGEETFFLNLTNPTNATISDGQGIGIIQDPVRLESNGHYYEVIFVTNPPQGLQWLEAAARATFWHSFHGIQGHLATIHIVQEQMLINNLRLDLPQDKNTCWIGLHRLSHDSPWEWVTGEPSPTEGFAFWYGNEGEGAPNNIDQWYAMMCNWDEDTSGRWGSFGNGVEVYADAFAVEYPDPPPTADAGQDQSVIVGMPVSLDGGSSSDPDGDYPLVFSWQISSAPDGSTVALNNPDSVTPSFTPDVPGTYVIALVVDDSYGVSGSPDQVVVTVENLLPTLSINDVTVIENGGIANFTVSLSSPSSFPVTVHYTTADGTATAGTDYTAISGTLTFAPGETTKTIIVPIVDDLIYEGDETFYLYLDTPTNATISDDQGMGTIVDNDELPTLSINDVTVIENGGIANFTVSLSSPSSFPVTVNYSTADGTATAGTDYTAISGTLTFAPDETTKTIIVPIVEDDIYEGNETFSLNLSNPTNATISDDQGIGTILSDDLPPELRVEALIDVVDATDDLPEATKTSLIASPHTAAKVLNDSNPKNDVAAINALWAFINKVEAQRGKKIPEEVAVGLIAEALDIIAILSAEP